MNAVAKVAFVHEFPNRERAGIFLHAPLYFSYQAWAKPHHQTSQILPPPAIQLLLTRVIFHKTHILGIALINTFAKRANNDNTKYDARQQKNREPYETDKQIRMPFRKRPIIASNTFASVRHDNLPKPRAAHHNHSLKRITAIIYKSLEIKAERQEWQKRKNQRTQHKKSDRDRQTPTSIGKPMTPEKETSYNEQDEAERKKTKKRIAPIELGGEIEPQIISKIAHTDHPTELSNVRPPHEKPRSKDLTSTSDTEPVLTRVMSFSL